MNAKKIIRSTLQYLFLVLFAFVLFVALRSAKILSQEVLRNGFYRELVKL